MLHTRADNHILLVKPEWWVSQEERGTSKSRLPLYSWEKMFQGGCKDRMLCFGMGRVYSFYLCVYVDVLSRVCLSDSTTPWTAAHQTTLFKGFSRQEYWRVLPFPPPGDRPDSGIKLASFAMACISRLILYYCTTWESQESTGHLACGVWGKGRWQRNPTR